MAGGLDKWAGGIQQASNSINNAANNANSAISNALGGLKTNKTSDGPAWGANYDPSSLKIREKLTVQMPDWLQKAGVMKIDFGSAFLTNPAQEKAFALAEGVIQDAAGAIAGAGQFVTPEALNLAIDTLTFIITDFISTVTGYATSVFTKYASPDFAIQIATDITKKTLAYTTDNLENPADIMKKYMTDPQKLMEDKANVNKNGKLKKTLADVQNFMGDATEWINKWGEEIRAYSEPIAKYMQYGPDYVLSEVESIYGHYLKMGTSWLDEQIGKVDILINEYVDFAAQEAGRYAADKLNQAQEWLIRESMNVANKALKRIGIIALAMINKVVLQLMAVIGG